MALISAYLGVSGLCGDDAELRWNLLTLACDCLDERGAAGTVKGVIMESGVLLSSFTKSGEVSDNGLIPDSCVIS